MAINNWIVTFNLIDGTQEHFILVVKEEDELSISVAERLLARLIQHEGSHKYDNASIDNLSRV